jgi:hypothetical protein
MEESIDPETRLRTLPRSGFRTAASGRLAPGTPARLRRIGPTGKVMISDRRPPGRRAVTFPFSDTQGRVDKTRGARVMGSRARRGLARSLPGALAALAAAVSLAPAEARAGCAHPAVARTDPLAAVSRLAVLGIPAEPTSDAQASPAPSRTGSDSDRSRPCTGPFCSGRDSLPFPAPSPAPAGSARVEAWCLLTTGLGWDTPGSAFLRPSERPARPTHRGLPPDRPPRPPISLENASPEID